MGENAQEEVSEIAKDVGEKIMGANVHSSQQPGGDSGGAMGTINADLVRSPALTRMSHTDTAVQDSMKGLAESMPPNAMVFGGAGLLPYVGTSFSAIYLARQASLAQTGGKSLPSFRSAT